MIGISRLLEFIRRGRLIWEGAIVANEFLSVVGSSRGRSRDAFSGFEVVRKFAF